MRVIFSFILLLLSLSFIKAAENRAIKHPYPYTTSAVKTHLDTLMLDGEPMISFKTDTSLNDEIVLYQNIEKILAKLNLGSLQEFEALLQKGDEDEGMPTVLFISEDSTQYLRLAAAKGSALGDIEAFEVGYLQYLHTNHQKIGRCIYTDFTTERGLHLDMTTEDIIALKGSGLASEKEGIYSLYYSDNEFDYPYDYARFYFKNNKLVRFRCGYQIP